MIDPNCKVCLGIGWVCENHPRRAWAVDLGCQCGAGMPFECVRANGLEEPDVSHVLDEKTTPRNPKSASALVVLLPSVLPMAGKARTED